LNRSAILLLAVLLVLIASGGAAFFQSPDLDRKHTVEEALSDPESTGFALPQTQEAELMGPPLPPEPEICILENTVQRGDTVWAMLGEYLTPQEIHLLGEQAKDIFPLTKICAGNPYAIELRDDAFCRLVYEIDDEEKLAIERVGDGFSITRLPIMYDIERDTVAGTVSSSLFGAVSDAGESPEFAFQLAEIFAWDIDFFRELRKGDSFRAVVEKRYRDGEFAGYGRILAAEFVNQGRAYRGFLFANAEGFPDYFNEQGESLRKTFLKAPLRFSRISSGFTMRRLHPIKKVYRPHPAIDYAAPTGTPVRAVGDGRVFYAAYDKAAGRMIKIRHNSIYETYYLHLSGFAKGVKRGATVKQGDVIGYVGSTGLSTGPHLDYRMKKHGSYVNPRTIESPSCDPVPDDRMAEFRQVVEHGLTSLGVTGTVLADASE
jgi:murein DD-endopeptidase MepM/ murein hydrolase activator NlpD